MTMSQNRRFPTLSKQRCSPLAKCDGGRDNELFSPPTLPYTLESVVENMGRIGSSNSPSSASSSEHNLFHSPISETNGTIHNGKTKTSSGGSAGVGQFFCNGSYGQSSDISSDNNKSSVPIEDVLRWKEFRRRQKEIQESNIDYHSFGEVEVPNLDSLSLSTSGSSCGKMSLKEPYDLTKPDARGERTSSLEIDCLGFPAQVEAHADQPLMPASLTAVNVENVTSMSEAPTEIASNTLFSRLCYTHLKNNHDTELNSICETLPSESRAELSSEVMRELYLPASPRVGDALSEPKLNHTKPILNVDVLDESALESSTVTKEDAFCNSKQINGSNKVLSDSSVSDDDFKSPPSTSPQSKGVSDTPSTPTLNEVQSFMNKLDSLREEQRLHRNKSDHIALKHSAQPLNESPPGVEIKSTDNDVYLQSLLEKKEKLRWHKLESERKRKDLDERLKAMRDKLCSPKATSTAPAGDELLCSPNAVAVDNAMNERDNADSVSSSPKRTNTSTNDSKGQNGNPSVMPGAQWSGGRAIWSSPQSGNLSAAEEDEKVGTVGGKLAVPPLSSSLSQDEDDNNDTISLNADTPPSGESIFEGNPSLKSPLHEDVKSTWPQHSRVSKSQQESCASNSKVYQGSHPLQEASTGGTPSSVISPLQQQQPYTTATFEVKDDFSFKPTFFTKQIPFSPLSLAVGEKSVASKFSFSSPEIERSLTYAPVSKSPASKQSESLSPPIPCTSPDVSEGDKGGGLGFGYILGDKSVVSKSSSKFVELGQCEASLTDCKEEQEEDQSLVGVTVVGSKEKKHEKKKRPNTQLPENADEETETKKNSLPCQASDTKSARFSFAVSERRHESPQKGKTANEEISERHDPSPKSAAPDPPGVESCDVWQKKDSSPRASKKSIKSLTVNCSATRKDAVEVDDNELTREEITKDESAKQPSLTIKPPPLSLSVDESTPDDEFDTMIEKAKAISNTPRSCLTRSSLDTPRAANTASLKSPRFRMQRDNKISQVNASIHALKLKFESELLESEMRAKPAVSRSRKQVGEESKVWSLMAKESNSSSSDIEVPKKEFLEPTKPATGFIERPKLRSIFEPGRFSNSSLSVDDLTKRTEPIQQPNPKSPFDSGRGRFFSNSSWSGVDTSTKPTTEFIGQTKPKSIVESGRFSSVGPSFIDSKEESIPTHSSAKPTSGLFTAQPKSNTVSNSISVKEGLTQTASLDNSSMSSFKGLNIKELRLRFEGSKDSLSVGSLKANNSLKSIESETKSSLESDTDEKLALSNQRHTSFTSRGSWSKHCVESHDDENDCTDGENSLDTRKVLLYAKKIERQANKRIAQDHHPEVAKTEQAGSGDTENSAKENLLDKASDGIFPNFSPVAIRKKAFEMRKQSKIRSAPSGNDEGSLKNAVLVCQTSNASTNHADVVQTVSAVPQNSTPRLSVKERVASFNSPVACSQGGNDAKELRRVVPFQTTPGTIVMSNSNSTPSVLWTNSQTVFSPMENFGSPNNQPLKRQTLPTPQHGFHAKPMSTHSPAVPSNQYLGTPPKEPQDNRIRAVQTSFDSPDFSQGDDDYDDGITLSPTCSEVSGLTIPTCLGSVAEDKSRVKTSGTARDFQECMSPIARHRAASSQKPVNSVTRQGANPNGNLLNHPYLKRMINQSMSNVSTPKAKAQQQQSQQTKQQQQQQPQKPNKKQQQLNIPQLDRPSHRQQVISRVVDKPTTPIRTQQKPTNNKHLHPQRVPSIKKSISIHSTQRSGVSNDLQSPHRKRHSQGNMKIKGKVAERVAMVNERTNRKSDSSNYQHANNIALRGAREAKARYTGRLSDGQSSTATRDCVRLD